MTTTTPTAAATPAAAAAPATTPAPAASTVVPKVATPQNTTALAKGSATPVKRVAVTGKVAVPKKGAMVYVTTPVAYGGQTEHAAIVTQTFGADGMINVTVFASGLAPMFLSGIFPTGQIAGNVAATWHYSK